MIGIIVGITEGLFKMKQTKEQKIKEIKEAVRVFKEMLDKTFLDTDNEFYGIGINNLSQFQHGNFTRRKDKSMSMQISLPSWLVKEEVTGLPMRFSDWGAFPVVLTLNSVKFEDPKPEEKVCEHKFLRHLFEKNIKVCDKCGLKEEIKK